MNRKEYNIAVEIHSDGLYRFLLKSMSDADAAKDVVQDVFIKLWEKRDTVSFEKSKSYLFTAGYRTMIDAYRKDKKKAKMDEHALEAYSHTEQYSDLSQVLESAVQLLPDTQRDIVLLRDYEGYSYKEIGEILKLSESQVKVYIFRARKFLQQYLHSVETVL